MILFSLYILVSAALLVQSLHNSAERSHLNTRENPREGYQRIAFPPQSKDSNLARIDALLDKISKKREAIPHKRHFSKKPCGSTSDKNREKEPEWAQWTEWAPCSVTCGKGREIRWRHCLQNCEGIETEMEEKSCQLPACEGKLFGLIKL